MTIEDLHIWEEIAIEWEQYKILKIESFWCICEYKKNSFEEYISFAKLEENHIL